MKSTFDTTTLCWIYVDSTGSTYKELSVSLYMLARKLDHRDHLGQKWPHWWSSIVLRSGAQ